MGDEFLGAWQEWRRAREARLTSPHGFLAITGLHWLDGEARRFPGVPGHWCAGAGGVEVELDPGEELALDGVALAGRHRFGHVDETGVSAAYGDVVLEIARRGESFVLRPRDPGNPLRTGHRPTPTYDPSPDWVVAGTFTPARPGEQVSVESNIDGLVQSEQVAGTVRFGVAGDEAALTAFAEDDGGLWILFADATSGVTTYGAGRQLSVAPPGADGEVLLDFNRAANLPCAYTAFTTCPFPPPGNRLPFAVEAGERDPARD